MIQYNIIMRLTIDEFIGDDILSLFSRDHIWNTTPFLDKSKICNEYEFDGSFFNGRSRVENKYKAISEFNDFYNENVSLDDLVNIVNPPAEGHRTVILGTTENLLPYVAYCLKFIQQQDLDIESGNRRALPFIFFASETWSLDGNIHFIDCLRDYYENSQFDIRVLISKDKSTWLTPDKQPRITICELFRLKKHIGNVAIEVVDNSYNSSIYTVTIKKSVPSSYSKPKSSTRRVQRLRRQSRKTKRVIQ